MTAPRPPELGNDDVGAMPPRYMRDHMLNVICAWAETDVSVTTWLVKVAGVDHSRGLILFGRDSLETKIKKLKDLHALDGATTDVKALRTLLGKVTGYLEVRNHVAHSLLLGSHNSIPNSIVMGTLKTIPGYSGANQVVVITEKQFLGSIDAAEKIGKLADHMSGVRLSAPDGDS